MAAIDTPIGSTLKKIRENKKYTQKQISDSMMARSTYTKFEGDDIVPTLSKYLAILDHLDISHDEFLFILNDHELGEKETVYHLFKKLETDFSIEIVDEVIALGGELVRGRYDQLTLDMLDACRGFKMIAEEHNLDKARDYASNVWARLELIDKYYLSELHLLNSILYFFDSETAASLTDLALKKLDRYPISEEAKTLKITFLINVTNVLLLDEKYKKALEYLELLESICADGRYPLYWGTALIRKEICLTKLDSAAQPGLIAKAVRLFEALEKPDWVAAVEKNPIAFNNFYAQAN